MARSVPSGFAGRVNFGTSSTLNVLGDMTVSFWIKFLAGAGTLQVIAQRGKNAETEASNSCFHLSTAGSGGAWDIDYIHEYGTGSNTQHTFNTNLTNDAWHYIGITRDATAKTVSLYVGDGSGISLFESWGYANNATGGTDAGAALTLFAREDGASAASAMSLGNFAYYSRVLSIGEHTMLMLGRPPQGNLLLWAPLIGASPEPDWSGNAFNGTLTNTTVVDNPPICAPFAGPARTCYTTSVTTTLTPAAATLQITAATPTVTQIQRFAPTAATLELTAATPTVTQTYRFAPAAATLTITGATPTVTEILVTYLTPSAATLTLTPGTPTLQQTYRLTPTAAALTLTPGTPTVGYPVLLYPSAAMLTLTMSTPLVRVERLPTGPAIYFPVIDCAVRYFPPIVSPIRLKTIDGAVRRLPTLSQPIREPDLDAGPVYLGRLPK